MILKTYDLVCYVQDNPVEYCTEEVSHQAFVFHKSKGKIVFVMPKDPIEILIAIIFVVHRVIKDLNGRKNDGVEKVV